MTARLHRMPCRHWHAAMVAGHTAHIDNSFKFAPPSKQPRACALLLIKQFSSFARMSAISVLDYFVSGSFCQPHHSLTDI